MSWIFRLWATLSRDKRSDWEICQEREFIEAANKLKNFRVTDRGGVSIDPEELRSHIIESRERLKHLVHPAHRSSSDATATSVEQRQGAFEARTGIDFIQIVTWRHLPSNTSVRYVCLQSINEDKFAIAVSDFFSGDNLPPPDSFEHRVAQRLRTVERGEPLDWYGSLQEAMDAHDASI